MNVNDGSGYGTYYLANDTGNLSDYKVTAYLYFAEDNGGSTWGRYGFILRAQASSPNQYFPYGYYIQADSDGDNYLRVYGKNVSGTWAELYATGNPADVSGAGNTPVAAPTYTRNAWHKLELEATGNTIKAELDDVEFLNTTAVAVQHGPGRIGIFNYRASGTSPISTLVDRITIESTASASVADWTLY